MRFQYPTSFTKDSVYYTIEDFVALEEDFDVVREHYQKVSVLDNIMSMFGTLDHDGST